METEAPQGMSYRRALLVSGLTAAAAIGALLFARMLSLRTAEPAASPVKELQLDQATGTRVTPHMRDVLVPGINYVYCATFQLAWNELWDKLGGPIQLEDAPTMVDILNSQRSQPLNLAADSYLAMAGTPQDGGPDRIRQLMREKFPSATMELPASASAESTLFFIYAYLEKNLAFKNPFGRLEEPLVFHSAADTFHLACFGIEHFDERDEHHQVLGKQVVILDYKDENDFILKLHTKSESDEIVLAKIRRGRSLQEMVDSVERRIEGKIERSLQRRDSLVIPVIKLDLDHEYRELIGKHFLRNGELTDWFIAKARQGIRFRLDETGAGLESSAYIAVGNGERHYVFDRPFLLYMKESTGEGPYFAMWIESP